MITVVKLEAKHAGSINQFCLRKVLFKVKLTLSAPKRVRIEDCKFICFILFFAEYDPKWNFECIFGRIHILSLMYSLISIRQNYNFDMLAMI